MNKTTERQLQALLNKALKYGTATLSLTGYEEIDDRVYLHSNLRHNHFDRPADDLYALLKEFEIIDNAAIVRANQTDSLLNLAGDATQLKDLLLDSIQKIKEDPNYIKQATAINNHVNTFVNITKLQFDFAKEVNKMNEK